MITLNLISPDYKKTIKIKKFLHVIQNLFLYILFISVVTAIILLIARSILEGNFVETVEQTFLISKKPAENKQNVETNKKIQLAQRVQQDYIPWSRLIIAFTKLVPENVTIDSLSIITDTAGKEWKMSFTGAAVNRNNFLDFQKNLLGAKDLFGENTIEIPITNLFEKENIKFDIDLKIEKDVLKNLKMPDSY